MEVLVLRGCKTQTCSGLDFKIDGHSQGNRRQPGIHPEHGESSDRRQWRPRPNRPDFEGPVAGNQEQNNWNLVEGDLEQLRAGYRPFTKNNFFQ